MWRFVPQLKFTRRGSAIVGTLPVRDRPYWYLMSIQNVVSNMVQSWPAMRPLWWRSHESTFCTCACTGTWFIHTHIHTHTHTHTHSRAHTHPRGSITFSRISSIAILTIVTCSLLPRQPIHSSAGCHKLAFYDAAEGTMGFALNLVEEE